MAFLRHMILGMQYGNFQPAVHSKKTLTELITYSLGNITPNFKIYAPRVAFTTRITSPNEDNQPWRNWFSRTLKSADGGIIEGKHNAIAVFNGDCPLLCLRQEEKLCVLHVGYRCLIRQNKNEEGIVEVALRHFNQKKVKAFMFGGIGSCCWVSEYKMINVKSSNRS